MINIAFVISKYEQGGIPTALNALLKELSLNKDYSIDLYVFSRKNTSRFSIPKEINVIYPSRILDIWFTDRYELHGLKRTIWLLLHVWGRFVDKRIIEYYSQRKISKDYDVAISYENNLITPYYCCMCENFVQRFLKARRKVAWIHNDPYKLGFTRTYLEKEYEKFDYIVSVSNGNKRKLDSIAPSLSSKSRVVYNCVDLGERVIPNYKRNTDGRIHIISISRLSNKQKRIDRMIDCCSLLKEKGYGEVFCWHMYGSGPDEEYLKSLASKAGVENLFIFEGETKNPLKELSECDFYVMTSDFEGYALTMLEAMSEELPVIVTNFEEAKETITDGKNGFIVDFNVECICERIQTLIDDPLLLSRMRDYIVHHPINNIVACSQFNDLINN